MSWGYKHSTRTIAESLQSKKNLINTTAVGTKIYKITLGEGISKITILWHDNRKTSFNSKLILKSDNKSSVFDIPFLKTQKDIFQFVEEQLVKLRYITKI